MSLLMGFSPTWKKRYIISCLSMLKRDSWKPFMLFLCVRYVHMSAGTRIGQKRALDSPKMWVRVTGYCQSLTWVMRSGLGSSAIAVCATNHSDSHHPLGCIFYIAWVVYPCCPHPTVNCDFCFVSRNWWKDKITGSTRV